MGEFLPFYCRGGNAKGDKTKGGRVHNMQAKPTQENSEFRMQNAESRMQNQECRIKNAQTVFILAMATILRRRIA